MRAKDKNISISSSIDGWNDEFQTVVQAQQHFHSVATNLMENAKYCEYKCIWITCRMFIKSPSNIETKWKRKRNANQFNWLPFCRSEYRIKLITNWNRNAFEICAQQIDMPFKAVSIVVWCGYFKATAAIKSDYRLISTYFCAKIFNDCWLFTSQQLQRLSMHQWIGRLRTLSTQLRQVQCNTIYNLMESPVGNY